MTINNPNPAQNIYNAPTQPQHAIQNGNRNRTIPIPLNQAQGSVHGSGNMRGTEGTRLGGAQNVNGSGGVMASSGGRTGHGGSARMVGQDAVRGGSQVRNRSHVGGSGNGNGDGSGASQHANVSGMQAQAQVQHQQTPVNYVHPQAHHPQAHNPHPHNPMNHIQPLVGHVFGPHAPHIPRTGSLLSRLGPYVPRAGGARFPTTNLGGNRSACGPPMQLAGLPVPLGYPQIGNVNAGGMGMGFGNGGMVVNGWDSRWDGSGGFRGSARGGRGQGTRRRRR
ncbi:hypothetical protein BHYA_0055g00310 [Botrytis hyacinthi]|uniref:Uncharacterized protein n=1 Tax=Botrytis hyacinthi TaxID=278943 RepID=A0A4Z1GUE4_9HELO|nr:hypothetical protein BHYA_0055g00310 [Botrytis hyacinthi]